MGAISILCPKTGRQVSTGIEVDPAGFEAISEIKSVFDCWLCGGRHTWSKRWATLVCDEPAPVPRPGGFRIGQRQAGRPA